MFTRKGNRIQITSIQISGVLLYLQFNLILNIVSSQGSSQISQLSICHKQKRLQTSIHTYHHYIISRIKKNYMNKKLRKYNG